MILIKKYISHRVKNINRIVFDLKCIHTYEFAVAEICKLWNKAKCNNCNWGCGNIHNRCFIS